MSSDITPPPTPEGDYHHDALHLTIEEAHHVARNLISCFASDDAPEGDLISRTRDAVQAGYDAWAEKPHNAKWVRKIDGTPIPNDLVVCIQSAVCASLPAPQAQGEEGAVTAPELWAACETCRQSGEEECLHRTEDLAFDGEAWVCRECWNPDDEDGFDRAPLMKVGHPATPAPVKAGVDLESLSRDAARYRWLRDRDLATISNGGVFAGMTPDNVVLSGEDLDSAIDVVRLWNRLTPPPASADGEVS
ncbi:hypothetical protein M3484_20885 [Pseudomonas sp. GX19020]|uniref:hypothetical protein n=1 Tax=Pseudomonas sp. GX19020 TaxID=2942277 RepID=UPI00201894C8|nr:hypothetical protein [Pseudomonas sp. GX19020]MCL4069017.1 hypothetical protein [Pseudomonas sp. GX19020]